MNRVALVGAGCGLSTLTLRAAQLLSACACVIYDSLLDEEMLRLVPETCENIFVGKRAGAHSLPQEEINALLIECAKKYPLTVRLKGGDPFVFGRGGEELAALQAAGIPCEVVAGITSCVAAAERFGIPVTHRGAAQSFTVLTAHTREGVPDFSHLADNRGTLVFLMAKAAAKNIQSDLLQGGMSEDMPCAVISAAGMPEERLLRCRLCALADTAALLSAPMIILVGRVCEENLLGKEYLSPPRVLVAGTKTHTDRVCALLAGKGMNSVACAYRRIVPCDFDAFFARADAFSWLVFTSSNGVEVFFSRARELRFDFRRFADKKFAAIGPATAEKLAQYGFFADLVPTEYTSRALSKALAVAGAQRSATALLRARQGSEELLSLGEQFDVYDTADDEEKLVRAKRELAGAACVTFSSAGGARAFLMRTAIPERVRIVCIGEETAKAVREAGYCPIVAKKASAEELVCAVTEALKI